MIREILFFSVIAAAYCQYPAQRAPPMRHQPAPEEYDQGYAPPPRQSAPPQQAYRTSPRASDVYRPAPVHYASLGLELAGDYKFGYDTGKGDGQSFREETRLPDGSVQGAYGYVDETGRQRIVKYTAGKDGFKAEGDIGPEGAPKSAPRSAPAPQPAYAPQPQPQPRPQPQPQPRPQPQPSYIPPPPPPAQPAYRPPQQSYRAPEPAYRPQPQQPAYRAPEPAYNPPPRPRPRSQPRPAPNPAESYGGEPDYDYPNNEIGERRLAPVDTSLFNYNIGSSQK